MSQPKSSSLNAGESYIKSDQYIVDRNSIHAALKELQVSSNWLAKQADISPATLSQCLSGKYPSSPLKVFETVLKTIDNVRDQRRAKGVLPFVETSVARLIRLTCDEAFSHRNTDSIGLLCGRVGVGKTTGLKKYAENNAHAVYLRGSIGMHKSQLYERLSRLLRISLHQRRSLSFRHAALTEALSESPKLIILDEASRPTPVVLESLRDMTDEAESGLVFGGRESLYDMLSSNTSSLGEIASRILTWNPPILRLTDDDVMLIIDASRIRDLTDECKEAVYACSEHNARLLSHLIDRVYNYRENGHDITKDIVTQLYQSFVKPNSIGWRKA